MAKLTIWTGAVSGDFAVAGNWSNGVPVTGDTAYFEDSAVDLDTNLDQSAILLAAAHVGQSYTGKIGTTTEYLQLGATILNIGQHYGYGTPAGSQRIKWDVGTEPSTISVWNSASSGSEVNKPPIRLLADDTATVLRVYRGIVGLAVETSEETSTIASATIAPGRPDANLTLGNGVTVTTVGVGGGIMLLQSAATTVTVDAGTLTIVGTGALTTLTSNGGTTILNSTGTITTLNGNSGTINMLQSVAARTVTTLTLQAGCTFLYDASIVTITNGLDTSGPVRVAVTAG